MNRILSAVLILAILVGWAACSSIPEEHKGATYGAGAGAAVGTATGAILGDSKGAVVGGLLGALVGGAVGHYGYDQRYDRDETASAYNYDPNQGRVINIEQATVTPGTISPGGSVDMNLTYALLTPEQRGTTSVTEVREITYQGQNVGKVEKEVQHPDGTYTSTVPLQLPQNAQTGQYRVTYTVSSDAGSDRQTATFSVQ